MNCRPFLAVALLSALLVSCQNDSSTSSTSESGQEVRLSARLVNANGSDSIPECDTLRFQYRINTTEHDLFVPWSARYADFGTVHAGDSVHWRSTAYKWVNGNRTVIRASQWQDALVVGGDNRKSFTMSTLMLDVPPLHPPTPNGSFNPDSTGVANLTYGDSIYPYSFTVPAGVVDVTVNGRSLQPSTDNMCSVTDTLKSGTNKSDTIRLVDSLGAITMRVWTLKRPNPPVAKSANDTLYNLKASVGLFDSSYSRILRSYVLKLPKDTNKVTLSTEIKSNASVEYLFKDYSVAPQPLEVTDTVVVLVRVTAENGDKDGFYEVQIIPAAPSTTKSTNDSLQKLNVDLPVGLQLQPLFDPESLSYTLNLSKAIDSVKISATKGNPSAAVKATLDGATTSISWPLMIDSTTTVRFTVTAQDTSHTRVYTVKIVPAAKSSNDSLSELKTSVGSLTPGFSPSTTSYSLTMPSNTDTVTLTPKAKDGKASFSMTFVGKAGSANGKITVTDTTTVKVKVTAENGKDTLVYLVKIIPAPAVPRSNNDTLKTLTATAGDFEPAFNSNKVESLYTLKLSHGEDSVKLEAAPKDSNAQVTMAFAGGGSVNGKFKVTDSVRLRIKVTAENGTDTSVYVVKVIPFVLPTVKSSNAFLKGLTAGIGTFDKPFDSTKYSYTLSLPAGIDSVTLMPVPDEGGATVKSAKSNGNAIAWPLIAISDTLTVCITVTAPDGIAKRTYDVLIKPVPKATPSIEFVSPADGISLPHATDTVVVEAKAWSAHLRSVTIGGILATHTNTSDSLWVATLRNLPDGSREFWAVATDSTGGVDSVKYTVTRRKAAIVPEITLEGGSGTGSQKVATKATGATGIQMSRDGIRWIDSASIVLTASDTIFAQVWADGTDTGSTSRPITLVLAKPSIHAGGRSWAPVLTFSDSTAGAKLTYRFRDSAWKDLESGDSIWPKTATTVYAKATREGWTASPVESLDVVVSCPPPVFDKSSGTYSTWFQMHLEDSSGVCKLEWRDSKSTIWRSYGEYITVDSSQTIVARTSATGMQSGFDTAVLAMKLPKPGIRMDTTDVPVKMFFEQIPVGNARTWYSLDTNSNWLPDSGLPHEVHGDRRVIAFGKKAGWIADTLDTLVNAPRSGTFRDSRDQQKYRWVTTVNIEGKKQTWMAQNLNYPVDSSWCYGGIESNCAKYGRLYSWSAAMAVDHKYDTINAAYPQTSACPAGWFMPLSANWNTAGTGVDLRSSSLSGSDAQGFGALGGGMRSGDGKGAFSGWDSNGAFWTSSEPSCSSPPCASPTAYAKILSASDAAIVTNTPAKYSGLSIRCILSR